MKIGSLIKIFPCIDWFHGYNLARLRMDIIGGLTVALVLVPQSMAYAQLAGLPAYFGLYAAFLPPLVASIFGSSRQLATGPVAVVSLMTATALEPLATAGSEQYIVYAILLALLVGIFQFLLGILRLGLVVNFLSHPVISGFTNAAALIIATSQLSKLFGVRVDKAEHHYETVYNVIKAAVEYTHWPTLVLAVLAFLIMIFLRRINRRIPNVLAAVIITTVISWALGFENNYTTTSAEIRSQPAVRLIQDYNTACQKLKVASKRRVQIRESFETAVENSGHRSMAAINKKNDLEITNVEIEHLKEEMQRSRERLRHLLFCSEKGADGQLDFHQVSHSGETKHCGQSWRLKVGNNSLDEKTLVMVGGGDVVGNIPSGLPALGIPEIDTSTALRLFPMAMIISLLGFMEAISIAKAIAAKTGQRLNPNQELIGQGLANIIGAGGQSYAVSGSFSRSAVNLQAGAVTGLSNVISTLVVVIVLLFLTPLLYYLPQSVLAAIIMMAVVGLISVKSFIHAWQAQKYDGIISVISFVATLAFAPHLDRGIMLGVALSLILYLLRNMKPALAMLALHPDGTYRNRARFDLNQCRHIAVIRYAGSLFFANVSYLEDQVIETVRSMKELRHVIIVGNGINELDASGVDTLETLVERLHGQGLRVSFSGLNDAVMDTMLRTGLMAQIGEENMYRNATRAINSIWEETHKDSDEKDCPLKVVPTIRLPVADEARIQFEKKWRPDK